MTARIILIGIGAGFAAALLFAARLSGTPLALPLLVLTGLPIVICGLAWTAPASLIATAVGTSIVFVMSSADSAAFFGLAIGLPATWLVRQAALSRRTDEADPESPREWYPIGKLLLHAAMAVAIGLVLCGVIAGYDPTSLAGNLVDTLAALLAASPETAAPNREQIEVLARFYIGVLPISIGVITLAILVFDLWLGALIARMSGRLERPRDRLWTVALPREVLIGFGAAIVISFVPGPVGDAAKVFAGAFSCAAAMVGLAVMHALTLGNAARRLILTVAYVLLFVLSFLFLLFALLGIGESFLHLRARRFGAAPPSN